MCGLENRGSRCRHDERHCHISLHLRRDGSRRFVIGSILEGLALDSDLLLLHGRGAVAVPPANDDG